MKYKVGDRVRIKNIDWYNKNKDNNGNIELSTHFFTQEMSQFCGKVMTIKDVFEYMNDNVIYYIDGIGYDWTDDMIEGLAEEETKPKFKVGDKIKLKSKLLNDIFGVIGYEPEGYRITNISNGLTYFMSYSIEHCYELVKEEGKETSWKPSKEEMDVLYSLAYITNKYDEHKEEVITRLYQDLKREFFNGSSYENMFPDTEDDVRRRSTIQVLEYARSLDNYNQYGKEDIDKNIAWLEKQDKKPQGKSAPEAINEKNIDSQNYLKPTNKVEPKFHVGESFNLPQGYQFVDENGNIINAQKIVLEKKKKNRYPKTYKECCEVLDWNHRDYDRVGYEAELLCKFQVLLLCRDAYWKIAGEEMGLGKPWKPDWKDSEERRYSIVNIEGDINLPETTLTKWILKVTNKILVFPTEEMRDTFYDNFKELIEICKELL